MPAPARVIPTLATLAAMTLGTGACTAGSAQVAPTASLPPTTGPTTPMAPRAYTEQALDLIGQSLEVDANFPVLREIALRKASPATTTAGTYDALRTALVGAGQSPGDLITRDAIARVPASPGEPSTSTTEGITVVTLPGFADLSARPGSGTSTAAEVAYARSGSAAVANAARDTSCGWVVDVRGNGSTDVPVLLGSIAALLPVGPALTRVDRDGRHSDVVLTDDAVRTGDTLALPLDPVARHDQPVVVLQDSGTSRAGEAVVLAFRSRSGSHSIGTTTFGAATDGTTTPLADGALVYITRWRLGDASGVLATGAVLPQESAADEVALDAARAWLRGRCGG